MPVTIEVKPADASKTRKARHLKFDFDVDVDELGRISKKLRDKRAWDFLESDQAAQDQILEKSESVKLTVDKAVTPANLAKTPLCIVRKSKPVLRVVDIPTAPIKDSTATVKPVSQNISFNI